MQTVILLLESPCKLIHEVPISHSDTQHSVGLLWTTNRPVAETSTWQHTQKSQQADIHATSGIRTPNPSKRAAADPRLTPLGHWDELCYWILKHIITTNLHILSNSQFKFTSTLSRTYPVNTHIHNCSRKVEDTLQINGKDRPIT
jgi:hypothetical protein